jgi:hypothetical protein
MVYTLAYLAQEVRHAEEATGLSALFRDDIVSAN